MSTGEPQASYDVVILGGGPAGSAAALGLAGQGIARVLVVEASHYAGERIGESIPPNTRQILAELGVLDSFLTEAHAVCPGSCSSWGADELGYNDFVFNPHGHGWHLDRRRFDAWLADQVRAAGIELWTGSQFVDRSCEHDRGVDLTVRVHGQQGAGMGELVRVRASFVIDATGARSRYARRCGARPKEIDRLVVSSGYFELPDDDPARLSRMTLLEAVEEGWWYLARLPRRRVAAALATSHSIHKQRRFDRAGAWLDSLAATRHILSTLLSAGASPVAGSLAVCTAPSFLLEPLFDESAVPRWLAVGDAASSFDPISSQGIHKGLSDGLSGSRAVAAALRGDCEALAVHSARVRSRFDSYVQQRAYHYGVEQRWPESSFWRERAAAPSPSPT